MVVVFIFSFAVFIWAKELMSNMGEGETWVKRKFEFAFFSKFYYKS
jgi:hypothetical protein